MSRNRLADDIMREERLKAEAYLAGQLAMRERAAQLARYWYEDGNDVPHLGTPERIIEAMIRALQPEEPK